MITDKEDKQKEEELITIALKNCLYLRWAIEKGKQQVKKQTKESITKLETSNKTR